MAVLLIGNVLSRTFLGQSWTFAEELGSFLIVFTTYIGIITAVRRSRHIRMSLFVDMLSIKGQKFLTILGGVFTSACLFYFSYLSTLYLMNVHALGRITPALEIPMWIAIIPIPLGLFLTGVQYLILVLLNLSDKNETYIGTERKLGEVEVEDLADEAM